MFHGAAGVASRADTQYSVCWCGKRRNGTCREMWQYNFPPRVSFHIYMETLGRTLDVGRRTYVHTYKNTAVIRCCGSAAQLACCLLSRSSLAYTTRAPASTTVPLDNLRTAERRVPNEVVFAVGRNSANFKSSKRRKTRTSPRCTLPPSRIKTLRKPWTITAYPWWTSRSG